MDDHKDGSRVAGERMGLRVIRILTNMLLLAGPAAGLGLLVGASRTGLVSVCLFMAAVALAADQVQHRVRSFRIYTGCCLLMAALTAIAGRLLIPEVWIPLTALSLAEAWCLYEGRVTQKPAFVPYPGLLALPILIWMVGYFGGMGELRTLAFAMETGLVLLFLAWHNQKSLDKTYAAASERTRVPYGKIRRLNTVLLVFYLMAALLLCLALTAVCSEDEAVMWIPGAFLMLFGVFFGAIIRLISMLIGWMTGGNTGDVSPLRPISLEAAQSRFPWLHTLWIFVDWLLFVIGMLVVVYLTYLFLYDLYYGFLAADPETGDTRKRQKTKEKREKVRPAKDRLPLLAGLSPAAGVRRAYISLIRMYPGGSALPGFYTPSQIEYAVAGEAASEEEWKEIHQLYEKAKYAPGMTDRNDLRRMRELVRRRSEEERRRQEMTKRELL